MAFRVWVDMPIYDGDPAPWKCVACFYFLQEALDYIAGLQDRWVDCVFQSPASVRPISATENRVVYRAPGAATVVGGAA